MAAHTRFECSSASLALRSLLSRPRRSVWVGVGLAVAVHATLSQVRGLAEEQRVAKPLTTQFVKRQPRLTKPLELKKRPQPRRRSVQRTMVSVKAREGRQHTGSVFAASEVLRGLARPRVSVGRGAAFQSEVVEPQAAAQMIEEQKEAKSMVDMSLEMLDVDAMDTGRYHAVVIQDPSDKHNIRGFFRLKYAHSKGQGGGWVLQNDWRVVHALRSMIEAMNHYTDIRATYEGKIPFTSPEMMKTPWVFYLAWFPPSVLSDEEAACLGEYLMSGGFVLSDAVDPFYEGRHQKRIPLTLANAHHNFQLAMATQGQEYGRGWTFEILPNDHPMFHCYFDFDGSPGSWYDTEMYLSGKLEGITVDGRLLLAICQKALVHIWGDPLNPEMREERMVQFGINTIIFALTQEGSITHCVVDTVGY